MSLPPAKRRRTSQSLQSQDDSRTQIRSAPATPRRASYRSPTKASLQRSHPHLARPNTSLRDHVMRAASTLQPQRRDVAGFASEPNLATDNTSETAPAIRRNVVTRKVLDAQIEQRSSSSPRNRMDPDVFAFATAPRLVPSSQSRRRELSLSPDPILPPTPVALGISAQPEEPRGLSSSSPRSLRFGSGKSRLRRRDGKSVTSSPLKPKSHNIQRDQILREKASMVDGPAESEDDAPYPVDSKEMPEPRTSVPEEPAESEDEEPELEGGDEMPEPQASIAGEPVESEDEEPERDSEEDIPQPQASMATEPEESEDEPPEPEDAESIPQRRVSIVDESVDSEDEAPEPDRTDSVPELLREKQALLEQLRAQKTELLTKARQLEAAVKGNDVSHALGSDAEFIELLKSAGHASTLHDSTFNLKPADISDKKQLLHLNLFAPGGLILNFSSSTTLVSSRVKVIHNIKVSAPKPWPTHTFNASFQVTTDAENHQVEKITYKSPSRPESVGTELHEWIKTRLTSTLFRTDLSGLIWGLGNYFTASIERAKLFYNLNCKYGDTSAEEKRIRSSKKGLSSEQAILLSEYLTERQLELRLPHSSHNAVSEDDGGSSKNSSPKILVIWDINLNTTSTASSKCHLVLSGVSDAAQKAAKDLFGKLARTVGYEKAFDGIWGLMSDAVGGDEDGGLVTGKGKGKVGVGAGRGRRKRKRIA